MLSDLALCLGVRICGERPAPSARETAGLSFTGWLILAVVGPSARLGCTIVFLVRLGEPVISRSGWFELLVSWFGLAEPLVL